MPYEIVKSDEEINDLIQRCMDAEAKGTTKYFGLTYEQGVKVALDWVTGNDDIHPLDEE